MATKQTVNATAAAYRVDMHKVLETAEAELQDEQFRRLVELKKAELKTRRPLWDRVFPWRIIIVRKGEDQ